ncbi:hypothetical protein SAMN05216214_102291 [Atopomonas hussainii]|uniref:Uncharacterized protein n=1 Tax=Atopomonas hussainii TaxID=1429083 RepID=A0A1H7H7J4_9GAMM|nr:hypothetical protein SAMN05216214_102291 [Atopomonas hussainii]
MHIESWRVDAMSFAVKLVAERDEPTCFALPGRVTFGSRAKSNQKRLPLLSGPAALDTFAPAGLRGATAKGYP